MNHGFNDIKVGDNDANYKGCDIIERPKAIRS